MFDFVSTVDDVKVAYTYVLSKNQTTVRFWSRGTTTIIELPTRAKTPIHSSRLIFIEKAVYTTSMLNPLQHHHISHNSVSCIHPITLMHSPISVVDRMPAVNTVYTHPPLWYHASLLYDSCMAIDPGGIEGLQRDMAGIGLQRDMACLRGRV